MTGAFARLTSKPTGRRFGLVPLGTFTRTIALAHARHLATVITALLIVALTLDVAPRADRILASAPDQGLFGLVRHLVAYIALRLADLTGTLLPLGSFLGLFWSEVTLTQTRERVVIWNGGRSPLQALVPLALVGVVCGLVQVASIGLFRPLAVAYQIEHGIGEYGRRFDRSLKAEPRWITLDNQMVRARLDYRQSRLVEPEVFEVSPDGRLVARIAARGAVAAGNGIWTFSDGSRWTAPRPGGPAPAGADDARWFDTEAVALPLDPLWLANHGIDARYLPQATLAALASRGDSVPDAASYSTWWHVRVAQILLPFGMMVLASALAMTLVPHRLAFGALMTIGLTGYFLHVATNIFVWIGEYGRFPAVFAAWGMPLAMIAAAFVLLVRLERAGRSS
ncbi:LptF/LptG family permease [Phreatobacter sp. AB_2022a]|uniref:LptF/LptG family permease n=1 Tax=Phreatobacter sp. AB_2022a TaxID=3003134 RepID=UPI0022873338|nr:LptF/LptG family permease [Phreatobacter sp. AB_2022a]MCZ0732949.1 LptF/LptG family permease [Phreatobacter sp. AB_2022a]